METPRTLRIPIDSAFTFGSKHKMPAVLLFGVFLGALGHWRPPPELALLSLSGIVLLLWQLLSLRSYWFLQVVDETPPSALDETLSPREEGIRSSPSEKALASRTARAPSSAGPNAPSSEDWPRPGRARLYRQLCLGKRVLRSREVDLSPYVWLRTTSVSPWEVTLELGNWSYQTLTLAVVRSGGQAGLMSDTRNVAIHELCRIGAQVSAMTGIADRGFREMA